jgi:outer membrane protein TolC
MSHGDDRLPLRRDLLAWAIPVGCALYALAPPSGLASPPEGPAAPEVRPAAPPSPAAPPGAQEFSAELVVRQVLARNPSLAQMAAAWQAARARYPQVTSLDDPMFGATVAPAGLGSQGDGSRGYRLEVSQKYPWCGTLALRGDSALAEARAAGNEVEDTRLQLIESAKSAYYDYYQVARAIEVNEDTLERLAEFRASAAALYRTPPAGRKVSFQDVVQADVEIGRRRERQLTLERMREVAVARLNTLMHLPPDAPLPPPPAEVVAGEPLPDAAALRTEALARRPDLQALANRVAAERAALGLAQRAYYPDVEVLAAYDAFWTEKPLQPQVGVRLNLPVRYARREGAVEEARARLGQREAELARQVDQVSFEVQQAAAGVRESARVVRLYEKTILPDAELNVKTARADYKTGQVPALSAIEAERTRLALRERYDEAVADYFRRLAALERAVGGPLTAPVPDGH